MLKKYPRTPHLPFSKGRTDDDVYLTDISYLESLTDVVVTEKLDGEGTSMTKNHFYARSLDSKSHPSRNYVKKIYSEFAYLIPDNIRISGESVYATHSIKYDRLTSYFYVFAIFRNDICLSWDETVEISKEFNLEIVPVLYRGTWDIEKIKSCWTEISKFGDEQEGYVVRNSKDFHFDDFAKNVAKYVRPNHVQTDEFWLNKWYKTNDMTQLINNLGK